jgi:hypothetical protein
MAPRTPYLEHVATQVDQYLSTRTPHRRITLDLDLGACPVCHHHLERTSDEEQAKILCPRCRGRNIRSTMQSRYSMYFDEFGFS